MLFDDDVMFPDHLATVCIDEPATDVMFWLRVATRGDIAYDPAVTACYRVTEGYSSENRFLAIENGRYAPTFTTVQAYRKVFAGFRAEQRLGTVERLRLAAYERRTTHGLLQAVVRRRAPGLRPFKTAREHLAEAIRIEPTVVANPLVWFKLAREFAGGRASS